MVAPVRDMQAPDKNSIICDMDPTPYSVITLSLTSDSYIGLSIQQELKVSYPVKLAKLVLSPNEEYHNFYILMCLMYIPNTQCETLD